LHWVRLGTRGPPDTREVWYGEEESEEEEEEGEEEEVVRATA
jgi:hypothetical protein